MNSHGEYINIELFADRLNFEIFLQLLAFHVKKHF